MLRKKEQVRLAWYSKSEKLEYLTTLRIREREVRHQKLWAVLSDPAKETHRVRRVVRLHPLAIKQKADGRGRLALPLAEGVHELLQLRRPLDFEEDFVVVVRHFDVEVFWRLWLWRNGLFGLADWRILVWHVLPLFKKFFLCSFFCVISFGDF